MNRIAWACACVVFFCVAAASQQPGTSPANESRKPAAVRSPNSIADDMKVPLCPASFHDSLSTNHIAGPHDADVTRPKLVHTAPALITPQAIDAGDKTHIGNFNVIVNAVVDSKGKPTDLCLQKSSGYGLDAAAAAAVAQYRFDAAQKGGHPVEMRIPVEVRFATQTAPERTQPLSPK